MARAGKTGLESIAPRVPDATPMPEIYLTTADLAAILRVSTKTILNRLCADPGSLPAPTRVPGVKGARWSPRVVVAWQEGFDPRGVPLAESARPKPARRGRPTKARQIARRHAETGA